MNIRLLIDRNDELALLDELLRPRVSRPIILIQAGSGFGKTLLLEEYQSRIEKRGYPVAAVDLASGAIGIVDMLMLLCYQWGWKQFPLFHQTLQSLIYPLTNVSIHGIWQFGSPRLQVNLSENPAQRKVQTNELTINWLGDVINWLTDGQLAVILIDSYNLEATFQRPATVDSELRSWLEDVFLDQVRRIDGLRLILAGQQLPERKLTPWERYCQRCELGPIYSPDDWMPLARLLGGHITRDIVSAYCHTEQGHPARIAIRLSMLRSWSSSA